MRTSPVANSVAASLRHTQKEIARLQELETALEKVLALQKLGGSPKVAKVVPVGKPAKIRAGKRPKAPVGSLPIAIYEVLNGEGMPLTGSQILAALRTNKYKWSLNNLGPTLRELAAKGKLVAEGEGEAITYSNPKHG